MLVVAGIFYLLAIACGIASLVFFIMVVVQMFKRDQSTLGIVCIILTLCTGVGPLIAFIFGWMKATEWDIKKTMTYWTVAFVGQIVLVVLAIGFAAGGAATMAPEDFDFDPNNMDFEFEIDESEFDIPEFDMPDDATFGEPIENVSEPVESSTE